MFRKEEASTFRPRNAMTSAITHLPGSSKQANVLVGAGCPYPAGDIKFYVDAARSFAAHGLHRDKLKPMDRSPDRSNRANCVRPISCNLHASTVSQALTETNPHPHKSSERNLPVPPSRSLIRQTVDRCPYSP